MEYSSSHRIFIWLKVNQKLDFVDSYEVFKSSIKKTTKSFIEEIESEMKFNNHNVVFMLLSLGFQCNKISRDLDKYWDYCYERRIVDDSFKELLIQFPKKLNCKKLEIYKELGDDEYSKSNGHYMDVDFHVKKALGYYRKINASTEIEKCLLKLQENKLNIEKNFPKPSKFKILLDENETNNFVQQDLEFSIITRTPSNNLKETKKTTKELILPKIEMNILKTQLTDFFKSYNDVNFEMFLDFYEFKKSWFYNSDIFGLMLPSFYHFYQNFKIDLEADKFTRINYVLPLDSLVIKFEGLIRLFIEQKGHLTINVKRGKVEENINFAYLLKQFEESIKDGVDKERFLKRDKPIFEHLFGQDELNLRNEIAHSNFKPKDYSNELIIAVIDAISRVGKYS
jgi:hypothetical protein